MNYKYNDNTNLLHLVYTETFSERQKLQLICFVIVETVNVFVETYYFSDNSGIGIGLAAAAKPAATYNYCHWDQRTQQDRYIPAKRFTPNQYTTTYLLDVSCC
ncbi:hypothetical protein DPMN_148117 [Dreissena polymorpha]|uniref:Uncharacterized protein n=1 Tax=Dreissena polymorpha TaxID=45954 RepID=A0A9D4FDC6_DREPO|nr:hypothetical protein DPMN_148117 [Dreissena polymorpha]